LGVLDGRDVVGVLEDFIMSLVLREAWLLRRYSGVEVLPEERNKQSNEIGLE
jgi:hypothetical protein